MAYYRQYGYILICMFLIGLSLPFQVKNSAAKQLTMCMYVPKDDLVNLDHCNADIDCNGQNINITIVFSKNFTQPMDICNGKRNCKTDCCSTVDNKIERFENRVKAECNNKTSCSFRSFLKGRPWNWKVVYTCIDIPLLRTSTITPTSTNAASTINSATTMSAPSIIDDFPTAAAVSVPLGLIVVGIIVIAVIYIWRKRRINLNADGVYNGCDTSKTNDHIVMAVSNKAYTDCCTNGNIAHSGTHKQRNVSASENSGYVEITKGANEQNNEEYNTIHFQRDSFAVETGYEHLPKQKHIIDNTYSHIKGDQYVVRGEDATYSHIEGARFVVHDVDVTYSHINGDQTLVHSVVTKYANSNRDHVPRSDKKDEPFSSDNNDLTYNTLQTNKGYSMGTRPVLYPQEKDDEYNHTNFSALHQRKQNFTEEYAICEGKGEAPGETPTNPKAKRNGKTNDESEIM